MGYQSVLQAAHVGEMLIELKAVTPHGEFVEKVTSVLLMNKMGASRLMTLARHLPLLREKQPDSQRKALEIIKAQQPHGEFVQRAEHFVGLKRISCFNLMTLARHLPLLREKQPAGAGSRRDADRVEGRDAAWGISDTLV